MVVGTILCTNSLKGAVTVGKMYCSKASSTEPKVLASLTVAKTKASPKWNFPDITGLDDGGPLYLRKLHLKLKGAASYSFHSTNVVV